MLELELHQGTEPRRWRYGSDRTVTIGRDDGCVLPLEDTSASRVHCVVTYRTGRWLIRDADSRNGTLVNRQPVQTRALLDGDVIRVGRTDIRVRIEILTGPTPIAEVARAPADERPVPAPGPARTAHPTPAFPTLAWTDEADRPGATRERGEDAPVPRTFLPGAAISFSPPFAAASPSTPTPIPAAPNPIPIDPAQAPSDSAPEAPARAEAGTPARAPSPTGSGGPPSTPSPRPQRTEVDWTSPATESGVPIPSPGSARTTPAFDPPARASTGSSADSRESRLVDPPARAITGSGADPRESRLVDPPARAITVGSEPGQSSEAAAAAAPASPAGERRRTLRDLWRASAWSLSLAIHGGILFLASLILLTSELVKPAQDFLVGLTATPLGRSAMTEPRPEAASVAADPADVDSEAIEVPALEDRIVRAMDVSPPPTPVGSSLLPTAAFQPLRVAGRKGPGAFHADSGEPGRREAIENALRWLARHQDPDGHWSAAGFVGVCGDPLCAGPGKPIHDVGVTGLALLAFLGAGHHHGDGPHAEVVRRGLRWLASRQAADGCVGERRGKYLYSHAIATAALCQAFAARRSTLLRQPAEQATEFLLAAQSLSGGWRYKPGESEADTSVTAWAVLGLKRAERAGFPVPSSVAPKVLAFLALLSDRTGHVGYQTALDLGSRPEDGLDKYPPHEATTAMALVCRILCDPSGAAAPNPGAVSLLLKERPTWGEDGNDADMIAWLFGSMALSRLPREGSNDWDRELVSTAVARQETEGCPAGSWPVAGPWAASGGRVYTTAIAALALEAPAGGLLAGIVTDAGARSKPRRTR